MKTLLLVLLFISFSCVPPKGHVNKKLSSDDKAKADEDINPKTKNNFNITCTPGDIVPVDCRDEVSDSGLAFKSQTCNSLGNDYDYGSCQVELCSDGSVPVNDSCTKLSTQLCIPESTTVIDCSIELTDVNLLVATKLKTCSSDGSSYSSGSCNLVVCKSGYEVKDNACLALFCTPGVVDELNCTDDIPYAKEAKKTGHCNADGTAYNYAACVVVIDVNDVDDSCEDNDNDGIVDVFKLLGNKCYKKVCDYVPLNSDFVDCTDEMEGADPNAVGANRPEKERSCNYLFDKYNYGSCVAPNINSCAADYSLIEGTCIADECTAGEFYDVGCTGEIANSANATKRIECTGTGNTYSFGACTLADCKFGYFANGNACEKLPTCPTGFIEVPGNSSLGTDDFCVAKYEMKGTAGNISSVEAGAALVGVSALDAFNECLGHTVPLYTGKFWLITNPQWMTIARNLEGVSENWSTGTVGAGYINRGWSADANYDAFVASPDTVWTTTIAADNSTTNCLYNTALGCAATGRFVYKRTHQLSNGFEIWDFGGNVSEFVDWEGDDTDYIYTIGPTTCANHGDIAQEFSVTDACFINDDYRPAGGYDSSHEVGKWLSFTGATGLLLRGGRYSAGHEKLMGIYTIHLASIATTIDTQPDLGFRCVYKP